MQAMTAELMERLESVSKEVGALEEKVRERFAGLREPSGQPILTLHAAAAKSELELPRSQLAQLTGYWAFQGQLELKTELLMMLKVEGKKTQEQPKGNFADGDGRPGGGFR